MPAGPAQVPPADTMDPPPVTDAAASSSRVTRGESSAKAPVLVGSDSLHASLTKFEFYCYVTTIRME